MECHLLRAAAQLDAYGAAGRRLRGASGGGAPRVHAFVLVCACLCVLLGSGEVGVAGSEPAPCRRAPTTAAAPPPVPSRREAPLFLGRAAAAGAPTRASRYRASSAPPLVWRGATTITRWPRAASARGSDPMTSPRPPVLDHGATWAFQTVRTVSDAIGGFGGAGSVPAAAARAPRHARTAGAPASHAAKRGPNCIACGGPRGAESVRHVPRARRTSAAANTMLRGVAHRGPRGRPAGRGRAGRAQPLRCSASCGVTPSPQPHGNK